MNRRSVLPDKIPAAEFDSRIKEAVSSHLSHEDFRKRVKEIFEECTDAVPFMRKVKGYAGEAIDEKIFKNGTSIILWLSSMLAAGFIGAIITKFIH